MGLLRTIKKDFHLYLMILPVFAGFIIFRYIPIINNLFIGFVKYNLLKGMWGSEFVGFKYFIQFFNDPFFGRLIKNTLLLGVYSLIWGFPVPIILALLVNEIKSLRFKRIAQSISYLPYFISVVVIVGITYKVFATLGPINALLESIGMKRVTFVGSSTWFRTLYIGTGIWQYAGWSSIIYLASIAGINPELYQAAIIDGANRYRRAYHITIPGMLPAITIIFILSVGSIIEIGFEKVFLMYSPVIYDVADVISTYVYRRGIIAMDFSYGGAVGFFNSIIAFILVVSANYVLKRLGDTSLF